MALPRRACYKADDIWDTPDDGQRYQVIDGELFVSPPLVPEHQGASDALHSHLGPHIRRHRLGRLFAAPIGVVLDDENGLQPDFVFVAREREAIISARGIEGAPDLVVEILSPSTRRRDRGRKMARYAAAGVRHYWIVDPRTRAPETYLLTEHGYELTGTYGPRSTFRPDLFPGLEIPIDYLWA